ncbi:hypothetical protein RUM4293_00128 [Ruegeria atlantica]|uniref:Uncharacterized protein n=1 Tax=Ruegeria atlantica TaxID=81569 RepID=A0A0N7LN28_9RHOB|nr:hypothetical protein RUM4293_00128 [Ruegeria atlantica]
MRSNYVPKLRFNFSADVSSRSMTKGERRLSGLQSRYLREILSVRSGSSAKVCKVRFLRITVVSADCGTW